MVSKIQPHVLFSGSVLNTYQIRFSSFMSLFCPRVVIFQRCWLFGAFSGGVGSVVVISRR